MFVLQLAQVRQHVFQQGVIAADQTAVHITALVMATFDKLDSGLEYSIVQTLVCRPGGFAVLAQPLITLDRFLSAAANPAGPHPAFARQVPWLSGLLTRPSGLAGALTGKKSRDDRPLVENRQDAAGPQTNHQAAVAMIPA